MNDPTLADVMAELKMIRREITSRDRREALAAHYMDFDDIAALRHCSREYVKRTVIKSPGFPAPCRPPTGPQSQTPYPLYRSIDVIRWVEGEAHSPELLSSQCLSSDDERTNPSE